MIQRAVTHSFLIRFAWFLVRSKAIVCAQILYSSIWCKKFSTLNYFACGNCDLPKKIRWSVTHSFLVRFAWFLVRSKAIVCAQMLCNLIQWKKFGMPNCFACRNCFLPLLYHLLFILPDFCCVWKWLHAHRCCALQVWHFTWFLVSSLFDVEFPILA